jgi:hypothetical protein
MKDKKELPEDPASFSALFLSCLLMYSDSSEYIASAAPESDAASDLL